MEYPVTTVLTNNQNYSDIANAIRSKNGSSNVYKPDQMATAISALPIVATGFTHRNAIVPAPTIDFHLEDASSRAYYNTN